MNSYFLYESEGSKKIKNTMTNYWWNNDEQNIQKNIAMEWNKMKFKKESNSNHIAKINSLYFIYWIFVLSGMWKKQSKLSKANQGLV